MSPRKLFSMPAFQSSSLAVLLLCLGLPSCAPQRPDSILLITVDTLRADHLSAYGYRLPTSPTIEKLAGEGTRFEFAFSASACTAPSTTSIHTGRYPSFHTVGLLNGQYELDPATLTLASILSEHGFRTGAIVGNPVLRAGLGLDVGFEHYDDDIEGRELNRTNVPERRADRVVELATAWLDESDDRPYFLWLHFQDPHGPYTPLEEWERFEDATYSPIIELPLGVDQSGYQAIPTYQVYFDERRSSEYERRYDSEIAYFDHHLGRLMSALAERDLLATTLIVLTADHGEAMGEDGFYFGHSHSVGLDQVRVPLIMTGPGVPDGLLVRAPVSNVSVMASILDVLGLDVPEGVEGSSLSKTMHHRGDQRVPLFFETPNQSGIVFANMYVRHDRRPVSDERFWAAGNPNTSGSWKPLGYQAIGQLDPDRERLPQSFEVRTGALLDQFDERASNARAHLAEIRAPAPLSPKQIEHLRALGYVE